MGKPAYLMLMDGSLMLWQRFPLLRQTRDLAGHAAVKGITNVHLRTRCVPVAVPPALAGALCFTTKGCQANVEARPYLSGSGRRWQ
jgi:hypothetical protein